ncbi:CAAX geranylgeranyltransferase alpha subunit [Tulasnella sp. 418]|nr:CAAX geranylgeranyltransferase alpha subunit [Tulasnella sp. 418]
MELSSRNTPEKTQTSFSTLEKFVKPYSLPRSSSEQPNAPAPPDFKPSFLVSAPTSSATSAGIETFLSNTTAQETLDLDDPSPNSTAQLPAPLAIEFMADLYLEKAFEAKESDRSAAEHYIKQANQLFESLGNEHDTIRKRYWDYRQRLALKSLTS